MTEPTQTILLAEEDPLSRSFLYRAVVVRWL